MGLLPYASHQVSLGCEGKLVLVLLCYTMIYIYIYILRKNS